MIELNASNAEGNCDVSEFKGKCEVCVKFKVAWEVNAWVKLAVGVVVPVSVDPDT
jgi:hypothetical protein